MDSKCLNVNGTREPIVRSDSRIKSQKFQSEYRPINRNQQIRADLLIRR